MKFPIGTRVNIETHSTDEGLILLYKSNSQRVSSSKGIIVGVKSRSGYEIKLMDNSTVMAYGKFLRIDYLWFHEELLKKCQNFL